MRVLIVDDEPLSRSSLEHALRERDDIQALDSANDAVEALELLKKKSYDVLLLDIHMPELSGIELADRLTQISNLSLRQRTFERAPPSVFMRV